MRGTQRISSRAFPPYDVIVASIKKHHGLLSVVAEDLGISSSSLSRVASRREIIGRALHDAREKMGDYAESKLFKLIEQGNQRAIEFYLASCHRRRGYGVQSGEVISLGDAPRTMNHFTIELITREQIAAEREVATIEHDTRVDAPVIDRREVENEG